ncbi:hypothetical protein SH1V18_15350 [Vallitalea longa]|uniref:Uncharacterized protein n=1 Tax=Vallitalea longa TaxID=2936439 RepID=A0A9W6DE33_9FIRM|nr:hypothetical protein [Vallitalea longa]GKX29055.1 hypothetical protein SH1V18_15350 [Vallitalea longa]
MDKNTIGLISLLISTIATIFTLISKKEKKLCLTKSRYFLPGDGKNGKFKIIFAIIKYILLYLFLVIIYIFIFIILEYSINNSNPLRIYLFFTYTYLFLLYILCTRKINDDDLDKYDKQNKNNIIIRRLFILLTFFVTMVSGYGLINLIDIDSIKDINKSKDIYNIIAIDNIYDIVTAIIFISISLITYIFISIMLSSINVNCSSFYKFKIYFKNNKSVECDEIIDIGKSLLLKKYYKNSTPKRVNIIEINKSNVFYVKSLITYKQYPSPHKKVKKIRNIFLKFIPFRNK